MNNHISTGTNDVMLIDSVDNNINDPDTNNPLPTYPSDILSILTKVEDGSLSHEEANTQLKNSNWMTDELEKEVETLCPTANDVDKANGKRSQDAFTVACNKLVPVDRIFASTYQISQCLNKFLPQWAVKPSNKGKCITCGYSKRVNRKRDDLKKNS